MKQELTKHDEVGAVTSTYVYTMCLAECGTGRSSKTRDDRCRKLLMTGAEISWWLVYASLVMTGAVISWWQVQASRDDRCCHLVITCAGISWWQVQVSRDDRCMHASRNGGCMHPVMTDTLMSWGQVTGTLSCDDRCMNFETTEWIQLKWHNKMRGVLRFKLIIDTLVRLVCNLTLTTSP